MRTLALVGALAVAAVAAVAARGGEGEGGSLVATVGPGFDIALTHPDGRPAVFLAAGRYRVVVHDRSSEHNFVLASKTGTARLIDSGVEAVGQTTVTVDLAPGAYAYACSPHFQTMNGALSVIRQAIAGVRLPAAVVPRGGRVFALRGITIELATGERVRPTTVRASAAIGGRRVASTGSLAWRIPRAARGKTLVLTVQTEYGVVRGTHRLRLRVR
jgi:hypothetical protein